MTAFTSPVTQAQTVADLGRAYTYLPDMIDLEISERLSVIDSGLVMLMGDLSGSGTDTMRVRRIGGVGFARPMTAMANETAAIVAGGFTGGYTTLTIGRYGIADEQSQLRQILNDDGVDLTRLAGFYADSFLATLRASACTTGATISGSKGTSGAALDVDDWAGLVAAYEETEGYNGEQVDVTLAPEQWTDLRASLRAEAGYKFPEPLDAQQRLRSQYGFKQSLWGLDIWVSSDVTTSGGDWIGYSHVRGGIGYGIGSTARLANGRGEGRVIVPQYGMVIDFDTEGKQAYERVDGNAYFGTALGSSTVYPQFKVLSVND